VRIYLEKGEKAGIKAYIEIIGGEPIDRPYIWIGSDEEGCYGYTESLLKLGKAIADALRVDIKFDRAKKKLKPKR